VVRTLFLSSDGCTQKTPAFLPHIRYRPPSLPSPSTPPARALIPALAEKTPNELRRTGCRIPPSLVGTSLSLVGTVAT
ncbi:hypothetical protein FA13DRAFT_1741627, partial [Coprinellus micaceus]